MKIVSWNVNSIRVRLEQVLEWIELNDPDVLGLQEIKCINDDFPVNEFGRLGYYCYVNGQKTYNGVALLSKKPIDFVFMDLEKFEDDQKRVIAGMIDDHIIWNIYVPNGNSVGSDKYQYKLAWLEALKENISASLNKTTKQVVMGDFNIAPEDADVHDPKAWKDKILCSQPEREALKELYSLGFNDSFRFMHPELVQYSWWDYRAAGYRRNLGLRIDLVLCTDQIKLKKALIDEAPRKLERPSDHAPVLIEF